MRTGRVGPSSIYSCSIDHILEHEFCHLGCWAVSEKFLKRRIFCLSMQVFEAVFSCFGGQKRNVVASELKSYTVLLSEINSKKEFHLSVELVVSEIFHLLPNSPNGRVHIPKYGL